MMLTRKAMCAVQIGFFPVVSNLLSVKFKDAELVKCTVHCVFLANLNTNTTHVTSVLGEVLV